MTHRNHEALKAMEFPHFTHTPEWQDFFSITPEQIYQDTTPQFRPPSLKTEENQLNRQRQNTIHRIKQRKQQ